MWLDKYYNLDSVIHNWEPRVKFLGLLTLIFTFAFINNILLTPIIMVISLSLYMLARLPLSFLVERLRFPSYFLIIMLILLIFISKGTILWQVGPLAVKKEGLLNSMLIGSRFLSILTLIIVLFGTSSFPENIKAMRALGLPAIFADIMTFTYRYFFQISNDLRNMSYSMKLRGFKPKTVKDITTLTAMIGTIFIRSFAQSENVFSAMTIRGYGQVNFKNSSPISPRDIIIFIIILAISGSLILAQIFISSFFGITT